MPNALEGTHFGGEPLSRNLILLVSNRRLTRPIEGISARCAPRLEENDPGLDRKHWVIPGSRQLAADRIVRL
jgi:hypothetical protein